MQDLKTGNSSRLGLIALKTYVAAEDAAVAAYKVCLQGRRANERGRGRLPSD